MVKLIWNDKEFEISIPKDNFYENILNKSNEITKLNKNRIRFYILKESQRIYLTIKSNFTELYESNIYIRDIGAQFSWKGVFYIEYLGPLILWPLVYLLYGSKLDIASYMWIFHFIKRLFETKFVHIFSRPTMPLLNLFKNSSYYWGMGILVSQSVVRNKNKIFPFLEPICLILFIISEILNGYCHIKLRLLRKNDLKVHNLPKGLFFNSITSPNYTFEIFSWFFFFGYTQTIFSLLFLIAGALQMYSWADKKRNDLSLKYPEVLNRGRISPFPEF